MDCTFSFICQESFYLNSIETYSILLMLIVYPTIKAVATIGKLPIVRRNVLILINLHFFPRFVHDLVYKYRMLPCHRFLLHQDSACLHKKKQWWRHAEQGFSDLCFSSCNLYNLSNWRCSCNYIPKVPLSISKSQEILQHTVCYYPTSCEPSYLRPCY